MCGLCIRKIGEDNPIKKLVKKIKDWIYKKWFKDEYEIEKPFVVEEKRQVKRHEAMVEIPDEEFRRTYIDNADALEPMIKEHLAKMLMDSIKEDMTIYPEYDVRQMKYLFKARIDIVS